MAAQYIKPISRAVTGKQTAQRKTVKEKTEKIP